MPELNLNRRQLDHLMYLANQSLKEVDKDESIDPKIKHAFTGLGQVISVIAQAIEHPVVAPTAPSGPGPDQAAGGHELHDEDHPGH